jgi:SpoVK/Ycf46/Vps4 family AAA+-type ATPase
LIRLDVSALKSSLLGESEQRMRAATHVIDAFGECVVWLDEIEKGFAGVQGSGQTDSGTSAAMFAHFLIWMQETTSPVLVMATANDISALPPEFLRAGRFDSIFFVDLPGIEERLEILKIQNARYGGTIAQDASIMALDGYTGAEIEQLVKDSLFDGYDEAVRNIVPLSRSAKEKVASLREWAKTRARMANTREEKSDKVRRLAAR